MTSISRIEAVPIFRRGAVISQKHHGRGKVSVAKSGGARGVQRYSSGLETVNGRTIVDPAKRPGVEADITALPGGGRMADGGVEVARRMDEVGLHKLDGTLKKNAANSLVGVHLICSFPQPDDADFGAASRLRVGQKYADAAAAHYDNAWFGNIHTPERWMDDELGRVVGSSPKNYHLHLSGSSRYANEQGELGKQNRDLDMIAQQGKRGTLSLHWMKEQWDRCCHEELERIGSRERPSCLSYKEQGIDRVAKGHLNEHEWKEKVAAERQVELDTRRSIIRDRELEQAFPGAREYELTRTAKEMQRNAPEWVPPKTMRPPELERGRDGDVPASERRSARKSQPTLKTPAAPIVLPSSAERYVYDPAEAFFADMQRMDRAMHIRSRRDAARAARGEEQRSRSRGISFDREDVSGFFQKTIIRPALMLAAKIEREQREYDRLQAGKTAEFQAARSAGREAGERVREVAAVRALWAEADRVWELEAPERERGLSKAEVGMVRGVADEWRRSRDRKFELSLDADNGSARAAELVKRAEVVDGRLRHERERAREPKQKSRERDRDYEMEL